jgi:ribonuclease BN (tRNA processing enzyme)
VGLRLTVLGSAAAWSEARCRPSSSYLLECDGEALVLDLGQGALSSLFQHRDPSSVAAIAVSHMHADHHVDLVPLRNLLVYGYDERRQVGLYLPAGLRERYDVFVGEQGFLCDLPGPDLEAGVWTVGPFHLQAHPVRHSLNSFAFRVSRAADPAGPGVVYSGDCGHAEDLLPLIRAGDTLLCEAFWSTREPVAAAMHLTAAQAAGVARTGSAARLVLTHILDAHDPEAAVLAARLVFGGPVDLAVPDLVVQVPGDVLRADSVDAPRGGVGS